jgi:hypothetical protein
MKNLMTPNITLAIVLLAAVAAAALWAAARRPEPRWAPGGEPAPAAGRTPGSLGRPASAVEQMQDIFHELHAEGRNAACPVCDSQYRPTLCPQRKPNSLRQAAAGAADTSGELEAVLLRLRLRALYYLNALGDSAAQAIAVGDPLLEDRVRRDLSVLVSPPCRSERQT